MPKSIVEAIGFKIGHKAAQAKNAFDLMGGTDEDSLRAEVRLGRDMAAAVLERTPLVEENDLTRFTEEIGRWLAGHVTGKKLPFSFRVTAEDEPKALSLPSGPVFVSWPLVELCRGERDHIGFLLAHEMAHIIKRHTLDRIVKDAALSLLLRRTSGRLAASQWLGDSGQRRLSQAFASEQEHEADAYAKALVQAAGGDACAGEALFMNLACLPFAAAACGHYFTSHPPLSQRLARLRAVSADSASSS